MNLKGSAVKLLLSQYWLKHWSQVDTQDIYMHLDLHLCSLPCEHDAVGAAVPAAFPLFVRGMCV